MIAEIDKNEIEGKCYWHNNVPTKGASLETQDVGFKITNPRK